MRVKVYPSNVALGAAAAGEVRDILQARIAERGEAAIILATGNSQLSFFAALGSIHEIRWDRVTVFHMDEYVGMGATHPASFRATLRRELVDVVRPGMFYGIEGDTSDMERELSRYAALLQAHQPVACVLGIGENGHLAFNDPPADFHTDEDVHVVRLAEAARQQQVGEGHFASLDDVPEVAITLTVPALLRPPHVLAVVPEKRKAAAVKAALEGPVSPECPASILRTLDHVRLYLDDESASQLG